MSRFESSLEKLGRILSRRYGVEVCFEGNQAYTNGKKIVLPFISNLTDEMKADLNGYLDHEVAHCKFTDFPEIKKCISPFHKNLFNMVEDERIETLMMKEFPGTRLHLEPLNAKWNKKAYDSWDTILWPMRFIFGVREIMKGKEARIDEDTSEFFELTRDLCLELRETDSCARLREITEEITKIVSEELKEQEKEQDANDEESENADGEQGQESEDSDSSDSSSDSSSDDSGDSSDSENNSDDSSSSSSSSDDDSDSDSDSDRKAQEKRMVLSKSKQSEKDWKENMIDVHQHIEEMLDEAIENPDKYEVETSKEEEISSKVKYIPATTKFDEVFDLSGKGNNKRYAEMKREVNKYVSNIKRELERILKVKENARWSIEEERGSINSRSLSQLATNKSYRTPFKQFRKTETDNVAVQILVDLSGSMSGSKIKVAKEAVVALSESLKSLNISFEVTGFHSVTDPKVIKFYKNIKGDRSRFTRNREKLQLYVFKDFNCVSLSGIEKIQVGVQNPDGECVRWAAKRLESRKEKRKILIVLSDGQPCTAEGFNSELRADLKRTVNQLKKAKIEVVGFGILTDAVKNYYKDYVVVKNLNELPTKCMKKLSKVLGA